MRQVGVRVGGGPDEDQAVGADAEVAVAEPLDGLGSEVELLGAVVDDDEVVAEAVHLRESSSTRTLLSARWRHPPVRSTILAERIDRVRRLRG